MEQRTTGKHPFGVRLNAHADCERVNATDWRWGKAVFRALPVTIAKPIVVEARVELRSRQRVVHAGGGAQDPIRPRGTPIPSVRSSGEPGDPEPLAQLDRVDPENCRTLPSDATIHDVAAIRQ